MIHLAFSDKDPRYVYFKIDEDKINGTNGQNNDDLVTMSLLMRYINIVDPICFLPTYKGLPFTQDFVWQHKKKDGSYIWYAPIGMTQTICDYFKQENVQYDGVDKRFFLRKMKHNFDEFCEIVNSWNLKYTPRDYQLSAAYNILKYKKSLSVLATRAGKTMISSIVFRYAKEYLNVKRILMIVPSIDLVRQGYNDFNDYNNGNYFNAECVWSGGKLVESSDLTIGTFQSLIKFLDKKSKKYNPHFFDTYDCVFVDEVHRATAEQTKTIISQPFMMNCKLVFGMTGTLPKDHTIPRYVLNTLLGTKIQEVTARELMDAGYIANVHINQIRLVYDNADIQKDLWIKCAEYTLSDFCVQKDEKTQKYKKILLDNPEFLIRYKKKLPDGLQLAKDRIYSRMGPIASKEAYIETLKGIVHESTKSNMLTIEKMMVHMIKSRIDILLNDILTKCVNNTILFCHHVEYLKYVEQCIKEKYPNRHIASISGSVSPKQRKEIMQMLKDYNDCILVASYACVGTGLTLNGLCHGILFESFKSEVINIQSIGRGLGLSDMRDTFELYDIVDVFDRDSLSTKILSQGSIRTKLYKEYKYPCDVTTKKVNLKI